MTWEIDNSTTRDYRFTYDGLNRMLNAIYGEGDNLSSGIGRFSENVTEYDRNGNIKSLQRSGRTSASAYGLVDNLTLQYNGNQLINVSDAASDPLYSGAFNFVDGNKGTVTEYIYDSNGNLQQDFNKNIANIQHNMLNLPSVLQFSNGNRKDFQYSADGIKRRVTHQTAIANISVPMGQLKDLSSGQVSQTYTVDYCGNVIYENGSLSKILTEEGYVTFSGSTPTYHYYLKDHQGNNRMVVHPNGASWITEQENHYYPFGGVFEVNTANSGIQAYKYNGKELDRMHGLDWYDYGARHYDAALGRWHILDPSSEKYYSVNPYAYCNNSPVKNLDLDGRDWYIYNETGELYFNRQLNHSEANFNDRLYTRIGGNNMMGDMKGIIEKAYSFEESSSIAMINGYSINPVQQIRSEVSREQIYQTGKHTTTIITGKVEIVNEQYGIFSVDDKIKDCFTTENLYGVEHTAIDFIDKAILKGQNTDLIERNYYSYSKPTFSKKIGNILGYIVGATVVVGGKHDYRNVTVYNNWNIYLKATNGKGRMLKYK